MSTSFSCGTMKEEWKTMDEKRFNALMRKIRQSESSFQILYRFYRNRVVFFLSQKYGLTIAEDAVQEFFYRLPHIALKQEYIKNPSAWVYISCENCAKRMVEKSFREIPVEHFPDQETKDEFDLLIDKADLQEAVDRLDDISKRIVLLFYVYGYEQKEIAKMTGLSEEAVRQRHHRAKKIIKKALFGGK